MATMHAPPTTTNWAAAIEGCLLVGIGSMLLRKAWDGQLPLYIHPRYTPLILATALAVLLIGGFRLWQTGEGRQALRGRIGVYGLLLAPLLLGVLIPAKPAGSALVDVRQLNAGGRGYRSPNALVSDDSTKWTLLDWLFARYTLQPDQARGKPVDVVGFVYHPANTPADEFYVVRYTLACCIADRTSVSLPVRWTNAATLANDRWVHVTGTIELRPGQGPPEFVIANAQVVPIAQPDEPYLYP